MERPKRRITSRCLEYNGGMLHEEELALRRALQASLLASKNQNILVKGKRNTSQATKDDESSSKDDKERNGRRSSRVKSKAIDNSGNDSNNKRKSEEQKDEKPRKSEEQKDEKPVKKQKRLLVQFRPKASQKRNGNNMTLSKKQKQEVNVSKNKRKVKEKDGKIIKRRRRRRKQVDPNLEVDSPSKSSESTPLIVHAQRKFAQSNPTSPRSLLLYQNQKQPLKTRAKTEDFLDFLCLRGTERMPKSLELFNSPCAPVSPLTDDEEPTKTSTSSPTTSKPPADPSNNQKPDGEPSAKRSLIMQNSDEPCSISSSSPISTVSSPVSTRVQSHAVLPQFTNAKTNYGVFTHIPTPIPCPQICVTPLTPPKPQGMDVYGSPYSNTGIPPGLPYHPHVTSVAMETHRPPLCSHGGKQGFYLVNSNSPCSSSDDNLVMINNNFPLNFPPPMVTKDSESKSLKCVKDDKNRTPTKSPRKPQESPSKTPTKSPKVKKGTPKSGEPGGSAVPLGQGMEGVPVFRPTEQVFKHPLKYVELIKQQAEQYGICVIVPPESWKPDFFLSDDVRFTTKLQHIHRFGNSYPHVELELAAIRQHLEQQEISLAVMPQIAGCELDLPYMSKVVREFGGLQQIIDKRKWVKVADALKIPKTAVERTGKLEQIYCKYLLSYDLLTEEERSKLFESVKNEVDLSEPGRKPSQERILKGRSMALSLFQRTSKNNMEHHFKPNTGVKDLEKTYWRLVEEGERYVVVHAAQLSNTAFPTGKGTPFSKSKWNLNVLPKILGSALRDVDNVEGISSPLVKVNMIFSTDSWKTAPHALYTLEYLHQGAEKIVYSIPSTEKEKFMQILLGKDQDCRDSMISPLSLINAAVPVYKVVQQPGQFLLKFPDAHHSSISSGYSVSELLSFAPLSRIQCIKTSFQKSVVQSTCLTGNTHLFSWEYFIVTSVKGELHRNSSESTLSILIRELKELRSREAMLRNELKKYGIDIKPSEDGPEDEEADRKSPACNFDSEETITCQVCDRLCFLSVVLDQSEKFLCLEHALSNVREEKNQSDTMTLVSHLDLTDLEKLLQEAREKMDDLQHKPKVTKRRGNTSSLGDKMDKMGRN